MVLRTRKLGRLGPEVSAIGLGCMGMSQSYGPADEAESIATLHRAIDLGCNFFDTAQGYGPPTNEQLLGRAFKGRRDQIVLATKFGFLFKDGKQVGTERASRPEQIREAVDGSLRRLNTDHVAADALRFDSSQMKRLDDALATGTVSGERYAPWIIATIDR